MSLTRLILNNRHAVWALALAATIFGAIAYVTLPMQLFPDTSPPVVNVITAWPGAAAEDVAEGLLPLEQEAAALEGIVRVRSTAQDNLSLITLEFSYERDVELAAVDVQNAVARVRGRLPAGIREPQVLRFSTNDRPVVTVGARGEDLMAVRRLAEDVFAPQMQQVPGVAAVDVFGGAVPAVVVEVDRRALEAHRIPLARIVQTVREQNAARPAGRLRTETTESLFRVESRVDRLDALAGIPVATAGGSRVLLGDLGSVRPGALEDDARFAIDGTRAIGLQVFKTTDANTVEVVRAIEAAVARLDAEYAEVSFQVGEESASFTETVVGNLLSNVWQALLLAAILIFFFLGTVRSSLVAALSMPLSYALTFAAMKAFGIELNMVTLTAVILAVGMVVDASVVVLENITRRHEEDGLSPEDAAVEGTDEVRLAVLAGAATTLVVLFPLLFLSGFTGKTFGPLALTLILAFSSSVIVALVFVPVLTVYTTGRTRADRVAAYVVRPFTWAMDLVRRGYLGLLGLALRARWLTVLVALMAFAGGVLGLRALGVEVLPKMDGGSFFVSLETPSGTALNETERVVREVEQILVAQPEVVKVQSQVGFEQGMRSFGASGVQGSTQGFLTVTLTPRTERPASLWDVQARVRSAITRVPGIRAVTVRELGNTAKSTTAAPVVLRMTGPDALVLDRLGDDLTARLAKVPGVVEPARSWRFDQVRTRVRVDSLRAGMIGLTPVDVAGMMQAGSEGVSAGSYHDDAGTPLPLWVRYAGGQVPEPRDLLAYPILLPGLADPVPLRSVARLEETLGQGLVTHDDLANTLEVSAFTHGRPLSFVLADVEAGLAGLTLPRGYALELTGEKSDLGEAKTELGGALAVAVLAVYLLLVAQFRSFLHPATVLMAVPLSLSGVALALALAGKSVSMPVMVGLVLLVGTVVNNSIILIDFVRRAREEGTPRREALQRAVATRFRPIMMTSLSTMIGMVPLAAEWALGAERFSPLATAVIGGMGSATLLTLIVIPVFYDLLDDLGGGSRKAKPALVATAVLLLAMLMPGAARAQEPLPLDLARSFELARAHSLAVQEQAEAVGAATARRDEATARMLPRIDLSARYSRLSPVDPATIQMPSPAPNVPAPDPVTLGEPIDEQVGLRATLVQPVFTGFGLQHGRRAAARSADLAGAQAAVVEADLALEVTESYFRVLQARELRAVRVRSVDTVQAHLTRVESLATAGRATALDVARMRGRLAEARLGLERADGAAEVARLVLHDLLGLPEDADVVLTEPLEPRGPRPVARSVAPEVLVAEAAADVHRERAGAVAASLWPQVSLVVGANYDRPNQRYFPPENAFDGSWDASVVVGWTAFDFGARRHAVRAADHDAARARRSVDQLERRLRLAIARAAREAETARAQVEAARVAVRAAEEAARISEAMFDAERVDAGEVLEREVDLTRTRAELVAALAGTCIAEARLARLQGERVVPAVTPPEGPVPGAGGSP